MLNKLKKLFQSASVTNTQDIPIEKLSQTDMLTINGGLYYDGADLAPQLSLGM